jgi:hypothetical protein
LDEQQTQATTTIVPKATPETYINLCQTIAAFQKVTGENDVSFMNHYVGFQAVEIRAFPFSVLRPGNINEKKRK